MVSSTAALMRLGPLAVHSEIAVDSRTSWALGFHPLDPDHELLITMNASIERGTDWHASPDDRFVGRAGAWEYRAKAAEPFVHALDLAGRDLHPDDREFLALGLLGGGRLESEWRPPNWFPRIIDRGFMIVTGAVATSPSPHRLEHRPWGEPQLSRHGAAAMLAAMLTGETTLDGAFEAAQALIAGRNDKTALHSHLACLLVETIGQLLSNDGKNVPGLVRALLQAAPRRSDVAARLRQIAIDDFAREDERRAWRARVATTFSTLPPFHKPVPSLDVAPPRGTP